MQHRSEHGKFKLHLKLKSFHLQRITDQKNNVLLATDVESIQSVVAQVPTHCLKMPEKIVVLSETSPTPSQTIEDVSSESNKFSGNAWIRLMTYLHWYPTDQPEEEKQLILKLDLSILIFGCLSFFTKYLDQQSITNAYVRYVPPRAHRKPVPELIRIPHSGMREDIGLKGDDLNYITATFWASYCTFMIPACYFMTHYPANIVLPALEVGWGLSTFGLAWASNVETIYAMRFFTGVFECCSFTGTIYIIGSWYRPREIGRRVALFFIASPLGTMFAGYLQAAAYTNLNGTHGLAGWRYANSHSSFFSLEFIT